ncbi:VOC family protein [Mangrovibacillus cuniculi]|uniref:VOC family protein n=1 Tax=Mangrovibacillus cuniculi TaxID=2593652 RepID=A0A7S8HGG7_9BACI|nr:VOC family protein [Mangrovibacillus cuniculi]QPC47888.1 VOC family protein [Mangrovibacillus cuniculi]
MFRVGSIFIPVTNLEKAINWYETNLNIKLIDRWEGGAGFYLSTGPTQLALVQVKNQQATEFETILGQSNGYFNFLVEDIEAAYIHLTNAGVKATDIKDFGGMKFFDFFDLDGNPFCVVNEVEGSPYHTENIRRMQENR